MSEQEQSAEEREQAEREAAEQEAQDGEARDPSSVTPDDPAVEPIQGDQGAYVNEGEQSAFGANPSEAGFNPDRAVATSAPPPEAQSGVPQLSDGSNADVEPQPEYAGPVEPGTEGAAPEDRDPDEQTTTPASPTE